MEGRKAMKLFDEVYDEDALIYGVCIAEKREDEYHVLWSNGTCW